VEEFSTVGNNGDVGDESIAPTGVNPSDVVMFITVRYTCRYII
jgi:hypothetical protein